MGRGSKGWGEGRKDGERVERMGRGSNGWVEGRKDGERIDRLACISKKYILYIKVKEKHQANLEFPARRPPPLQLLYLEPVSYKDANNDTTRNLSLIYSNKLLVNPRLRA
ncbi:hypothetical protein Pmani_007740 [Petrolisthes manimaculis]|uniref:Uncharacterized protein n=1 Tax=Petrolisthes manimaculis TaxID=1843537 RepID=A0AAE1QA91_9EUCA|nr:hypothetical protein Pmani_007740 [Petrolisthes manimaculis]